MRPAPRSQAPITNRRLPGRPARRGRTETSAAAYAVFYTGTGLGIALLLYAGFFLSGPAPRIAHPPPAQEMLATIKLNQGDGKGLCRQMVFDNASGRFADGGTGRCPDLIPQEMLTETVRSRSILANSFNRAFK